MCWGTPAAIRPRAQRVQGRHHHIYSPCRVDDDIEDQLSSAQPDSHRLGELVDVIEGFLNDDSSLLAVITMVFIRGTVTFVAASNGTLVVSSSIRSPRYGRPTTTTGDWRSRVGSTVLRGSTIK